MIESVENQAQNTLWLRSHINNFLLYKIMKMF